MRLRESIVIAASPRAIWDYLLEPDNALHYMAGVTRWDVEGDKRSGPRRPLPDADAGRLGRDGRPRRDRRVQP